VDNWKLVFCVNLCYINFMPLTFDTLSQFYVRSRYPDYTHELELSATNERAQYVYEKSKEAYQWLLTMKPHGESSANMSPM
jgi:hypothetical protein